MQFIKPNQDENKNLRSEITKQRKFIVEGGGCPLVL
jgi:hypothetical protein